LGSPWDVVRRKHLERLAEYTGRNVIVYYSGWLQKPDASAAVVQVNDNDKNGLMATIHQLDRAKGLDLLLHTPGGDTAATESIVDYLRSMFGTDIRAIVPQLAMSAGTMIAMSCGEIIMGTHSSLGPIDPQFGGVAAHAVVEEFKRALEEVQANPATTPIWQVIVSRYNPTLIGECERSIKWSEEMVHDWLKTGMFRQNDDADALAATVVAAFADHDLTRAHGRHISMAKAVELGLPITALEGDQELQDRVLTVHHACAHTLAASAAVKLIENHNGIAFIQSEPVLLTPQLLAAAAKQDEADDDAEPPLVEQLDSQA